jgi:cholestenol delta-isomerase
MDTDYGPLHPYFPPSLDLPLYTPNHMDMSQILLVMFTLFVFLVSTSISVSSMNERITWTDRWTFTWFILCGCIHLFLEGHFAYYHDTLVGDSSFLSQVWKEYALSDSRYLVSDPFVLSMETITAVGVFLWDSANGELNQSF